MREKNGRINGSFYLPFLLHLGLPWPEVANQLLQILKSTQREGQVNGEGTLTRIGSILEMLIKDTG